MYRELLLHIMYYSDLLTQKIKPALRPKRRNRSIRSVILLHAKIRPHTAQLTINVLGKIHLEVLPRPPYSPDLSPFDFHSLDR
jgi:transposase